MQTVKYIPTVAGILLRAYSTSSQCNDRSQLTAYHKLGGLINVSVHEIIARIHGGPGQIQQYSHVLRRNHMNTHTHILYYYMRNIVAGGLENGMSFVGADLNICKRKYKPTGPLNIYLLIHILNDILQSFPKLQCCYKYILRYLLHFLFCFYKEFDLECMWNVIIK